MPSNIDSMSYQPPAQLKPMGTPQQPKQAPAAGPQRPTSAKPNLIQPLGIAAANNSPAVGGTAHPLVNQRHQFQQMFANLMQNPKSAALKKIHDRLFGA